MKDLDMAKCGNEKFEENIMKKLEKLQEDIERYGYNYTYTRFLLLFIRSHFITYLPI